MELFLSACIKSCYQLTFSQRVGSLQLLIFFGIFFSIVFVFRSKIFNRYKQQKQKKNTYALLATESNNNLYGICSGAWNFGGRIERGEQKKQKNFRLCIFRGIGKFAKCTSRFARDALRYFTFCSFEQREMRRLEKLYVCNIHCS